ncbi:MAG TPA: YceI family protein [Myxococcota bacterium]|nr:YceI family protein [Myxococcota bacterium]
MTRLPFRKLFLAATTVVALAIPLIAHAALKVDGKPKISFFAVGNPGFLDIEGVSSTMTVVDDGTKLVFTVPMASVKTGIDTRDEHMNDKYVVQGKYPDAILTLAKADVQWPTEVGVAASGKVKATFNIHGQDQAVEVEYTNRKSKTGWRVSAKFNYDTSASGIEIPSYLGVSVEAKQRAEVTIDLIDG